MSSNPPSPLPPASAAPGIVVDPRLIDPRFVSGDEHFAVHAGLWRDSGQPAIVQSIGSRTGAERWLATLRTEAQILALLDGLDGVPAVLHADLERGMLALTRARGRPLDEAWRPPVEPARAIRLGLALAKILGAIHDAGVFHARLQPGCVIVDEEDRPTLVDFGEAAAQSHREAALPGAELFGAALPFRAPEQTGRTGQSADYRADHHALGALLYWMLTGAPPFAETDPLALVHALLARTPTPLAALRPRLPASVSAIVQKLLAKQPQQRYQSAESLCADLRHALAVAEGHADDAGFLPGRNDRRVVPALPSRLVGRTREAARLAAALDAEDGTARLVLVSGGAGTGKSALVRSRQPALAARGGLFCAGKFDQFQPATSASGLAEALDQIADAWLSEPPEVLARLRTRLHEVLGGNAELLVRAAPAFGAVLWGDAGEPDAGPERRANAPERMQQAVVGLLQVAAERGAPLLVFIDDLQWADAHALKLVEAIALQAARPPVRLVAAFRDDTPGALAGVFALRDRIARSSTAVVEIAVEPLDAAATAALVADMLGGDEAPLRALAETIHHRTEGNPFFAVQALRRLYDSGALTGRGGRWRWDDAALRALPGSSELQESLVAELQRLPRETRHLAGGCACLGRVVDLGLLAEAQQRPASAVDAALLPLLQRDILVATRERGRLRFGHDRLQQAARTLIDASERIGWHLGFARALRARGLADEEARLAFADHCLAGLPGIADPDERRAVLGLLLDVRREVGERFGHETTGRFVEAAERLAEGLAIGAELSLKLDIARHTVLYLAARYDEADRVFARLADRFDEAPVPVCQAAFMHGKSLANRRRSAEAIDFVLRYARRIGVDHPAGDAWEPALAEEVQAVQARLAQRGVGAFDTLAPVERAEIDVAMMMVTLLVGMSSAARPLLARWGILRLLRLGLDHGRTRLLPVALSLAPLAFGPCRDDHETGYALAMAGVRMLKHYEWRSLRQAVHRNVVGYALHWGEPLENARHPRWAEHRKGPDGDRDDVRSFATLLAASLESAPRLEDTLAEAERAIAVASADPVMAALSRGYRQFVRCLQGRTVERGFDDDDFREAEAVAALAGEADAQAAFLVLRGQAHALWGDWPGALREARAAEARGAAELATVTGVTFHGLLALALSEGLRRGEVPPEAGTAQRHTLEGWLARRAAAAPANFAPAHALLAALRAAAEGRDNDAAAAFEAAADAALAHHRPGTHALACTLAGEFSTRAGRQRAARAWFGEALEALEAWGATGPAARLRARGVFAAAELAPPAAPGSVGIDAISVAKASQALAGERDPEALTGVLFDLVQHYAAAECGVLLWHDGDDWSVRAQFDAQRRWIAGEVAGPAQAGPAVPAAVLHYLTQSRRPLVLNDPSRHPRFAQEDPRLRTIIGLPLAHRGRIAGVLYLENREVSLALAPAQIETLRLVGLQFAIVYENALINRHLESLVEERTEALRREIAERRRAESAAEAANAAKSRFLANMSHEIRTPMNAILGMLHLAREDAADPRRQGYLQKAERAANVLLRLIDDILDVSRIEAGRLELESTPFVLDDVLEGLADIVGLQAERKGLPLRFEVAPAPAGERLRGDPLRLGQVLVNLAGNAVKFTERGEVVVRVDEERRAPDAVHLRFAVQDTGVGLGEAERRRLFQPFAQADSSTSRRYGGSGLGLAISRRLVELMGGTIALESAPGIGSTFSFSLRFALAEPAPAADPPPPGRAEAQASLRGTRLLVVEDNEINEAFIVEVLRRAGSEVVVARDGRSALAQVAAAPFDAVLMDCHMPVMDGYAATRALRADARWRSLPVIAMTASAISGDREQALAAGMNDHVTKPIAVDALFATLARWVRPGAAGSATSAAGCAAAAQAADWPALPGIDVAHGIARALGDAALYRELLRLFRDRERDFGSRWQACLGRDDADGARRLAHNLHTAGAGLGMAAVAAAAAALDLACRRHGAAGEAADERPALAAALQREMDRVIAGLDALEA